MSILFEISTESSVQDIPGWCTCTHAFQNFHAYTYIYNLYQYITRSHNLLNLISGEDTHAHISPRLPIASPRPSLPTHRMMRRAVSQRLALQKTPMVVGWMEQVRNVSWMGRLRWRKEIEKWIIIN